MVSFADLATQYIEKHAKVYTRNWQATQATLDRNILPTWSKRQITAIGRQDVIELIDNVPGAVLPNRVLALISGIFRFAIDKGLLEATPVTFIKRKPEKPRDKILSTKRSARFGSPAIRFSS